jgi:hypothetical protein
MVKCLMSNLMILLNIGSEVGINMAGNGFGLAEVGDLEPLKLKIITNVK